MTSDSRGRWPAEGATGWGMAKTGVSRVVVGLVGHYADDSSPVFGKSMGSVSAPELAGDM
jgi:hypothetical protein